MAITTEQKLAGIDGAFTDPDSWNRAMLRLALTDSIAEKAGEIAQGQATIGEHDTVEQAWLEARRAELAALEAQLTALASVPTVPTE